MHLQTSKDYNMIFLKMGKLYYPRNKIADDFLKSFPHSRGARKALTEAQIDVLFDLGVSIQIQQQGENNARVNH